MLLDIQESRIEPDITVLKLSGKLALGRESQRIEAMVDEFSRRSDKHFILDMMDVNYLDSAGIGLLALAAGKLRNAGGKLAVVAPLDGRPTQLLKLTQMNAIVPLFSSIDEARASFVDASTSTQPPASA